MRRVITEVPFANHSRAIAILRKHTGNRSLIGMQHRSSGARSVSAGSSRMTPRHESCTTRRAERANVEIRKSNRLRIELINVRCFHDRIPVTSEVTIPLIIGHDENDVGSLRT